jgi:hypothetical protein
MTAEIIVPLIILVLYGAAMFYVGWYTEYRKHHDT